MDSQINVLIRRKGDDLEEAERELEGKMKEISQFEAKLTTCKEQLRDKRRERNETGAKVMEVCESDISEFPEVLKRLEDEVGNAKMYFPVLSKITDRKEPTKFEVCWWIFLQIFKGSESRSHL